MTKKLLSLLLCICMLLSMFPMSAFATDDTPPLGTSSITDSKKDIDGFSVAGIKAITNGGTFPDGTTFTAGTLATPEKEGYIFGGWYATSDFTGTAVTAATAGSTYYAKWFSTNGYCGDPTVNDGKDVTWAIMQNNTDSINPTYTLTILGTGATADYELKSTPWEAVRTQVTSLVIGEGITYLGNHLFNEMTNLKIDITLPNSVTAVGTNLFRKSGITGVDLNQVTVLDKNAFAFACPNLLSVDLGAVTTITGNNNFRSCVNLTSITADQLISLPSTANEAAATGIYNFHGNTALSQVIMPKLSVAGYAQFTGCTQLTAFVSYATMTQIGDSLFSGAKAGSVVYVPDQQSASNLFAASKAIVQSAVAVLGGGTFAANTTFTAGTLATPTKDGYVFGGWYDNADFTGDKVTTVTAGSTYYAKWREPNITFTDKTGTNAFTYDGKAKTLASATLEGNADATFTYTYALRTNADGEETYGEASSTAPINAGYYKVVATLSGSDRTATAYLEIKPADITATTKEISVQQGDTTLQQLDLSTLNLTPNLSAIGAVSYTIQSTQDTNNILDGAVTIVDGKLQFKLKEVVNDKHTASIAVKITPTSANYNSVVTTIVVKITKDTIAPTMTANPTSGVGTIIGLNDTITVTFNKKMIGTPTIAVNGGVGTASAELAQNGLSMIITPSSLANSTAYTFTINGLTDVAGNALAGNALTYTTIKVAEANGTAVPTITGSTTIIDGNPDAVLANISLGYTAQVATADQTTLNTAPNLPNGFNKTAVFFELELKVNGIVINNPTLNRANTVTIPYAVASNTTYKLAHLKSDGGIEILDATADQAKQTITFSVTGMSPFMVLSKYTAPSGGGGGSSYDYYDIKISKEGNGSISPNGGWNNTVTIREWSDQTFTFTPDKGYVVSDVLVDGKSIGAKASYTFKDITKDHTLKVIFKATGGHENPQTGIDFEDVSENDWFYKAVNNAVEKGWFTGTSTTTFSPYLSTTRGMIATVLWRMENKADASTASIFEDVVSGTYYVDGVNWAQENGIVGGYGNGKFGPQDNITREQMAAILYRYSQFKSYDVTKTASLDSFTDGIATSDYAKIPMSWAVANRLINGKGNGLLDPHGNATRAEVAAILTRFEDLFNNQ